MCKFFGFICDEEEYQLLLMSKDSKRYVIYEDELILYSGEFTSSTLYFHLGNNFPKIDSTYKAYLYDEHNNEKIVVANKNGLYKSKYFNDHYTYDGQLGSIYSKNSTIFRVWSPISKKILLRIYDNYQLDTIKCDYQMNKLSNGVFELELQGDYSGVYYNYVVTNEYVVDKVTTDPYAKGVGINGRHSMVVDFSITNPEGFNEFIPPYQDWNNLTVYESHIVDLTSSNTYNGKYKKLYKGFYEENTTYNGVKTGFDHIVELGVNAVQLLPIFDYSNEEREELRVFNWGYDPLNYNSLEGSYSLNPYDGYERIKEFKNLVYAYGKKNIGIIMDVVYNHMNSIEESSFGSLMPYYYFRYNKNEPKDGSMCGNETASEMKMMRKFIIDSVLFWATEYKLIGFRFDLMGIHDTSLMEELSRLLHERLSDKLIVYGEPWSAKPVEIENKIPANLDNTKGFNGYGCFNDKIRDALIKGGLNPNNELGYVTNTKSISKSDNDFIHKGIRGKNSKFKMDVCINYVTCHDNYTLHDRIEAAGVTDYETRKKMAMLANAMIFTSFGTAFMLSGEEFLRSKGGNENSYNAPYEVNELDYNLKIKNLDMFKNYQKLIKFKQNKNLFTNRNLEELNVVLRSHGSLMYYDLTDYENNLRYRIIHSNGIDLPKRMNLVGYEIYLDTLNENELVISKRTEIKPFQTIIAVKKI